ncbi:MAG: hypothetical protein IPM71_15660 [Bacteroidota bacterium]|nr:MAG: hypothetical protein IPM71_15660 [Bacteroidota bacterium]
MKKTAFIIIISILLINLSGHSQGLRTTILDTINSFDSFNFEISSPYKKADFKKYTENIRKLFWLKESITENELIYLINSSDSMLVAFAFEVLYERKSPILAENYINLLQKEPLLLKRIFRPSCIIVQDNEIYDFTLTFFENVYNVNLSEKEKDIIDSICLYSDGRNRALQSGTLASTKPKAEYYERVRKLALDTTTSNSIFTLLAKYRKQQDIELIQTLYCKPDSKNQFIRAVRYFPDSAFKPQIKNICYDFVDKSKNGLKSDISYRLFCSLLIQYQGKWFGDLYYYAENNLNKEDLKRFNEAMLYALTIFPKHIYSSTYNYLVKDLSLFDQSEYIYHIRSYYEKGFDIIH